jgi:DNA invertase Pin-like site-specific DNA recombinase
VYGYIRISTGKQDTENQRFEILKYANENKLGSVEFLEETISGRKSWKDRKIGTLVQELQKGDILIITELSRLGRSMLEVMELLSILLRKGVELHVVKNKQVLKDDLHSKVFAMAFSIAAEIERELISQRTKEALARRKAEGKPIGRPKGSFSSSLDKHREQIEEFLRKGVSISSIAKILEVPYGRLWDYVKRRGLKRNKSIKA